MRRLLWTAALVVCLGAVAGADPAGEPGGGVGEEALRFYRQGVEHFRRQQWDQAVRAYLQAVRLDPGS